MKKRKNKKKIIWPWSFFDSYKISSGATGSSKNKKAQATVGTLANKSATPDNTLAKIFKTFPSFKLNLFKYILTI